MQGYKASMKDKEKKTNHIHKTKITHHEIKTLENVIVTFTS